MTIEACLKLLDGRARQGAPRKRGRIPDSIPTVLKRLGLNSASWSELIGEFGMLFCAVAGRPEHVVALRSHRTHRRYQLRRRARELFATSRRDPEPLLGRPLVFVSENTRFARCSWDRLKTTCCH
jgi:hypothetical protein